MKISLVVKYIETHSSEDGSEGFSSFTELE